MISFTTKNVFVKYVPSFNLIVTVTSPIDEPRFFPPIPMNEVLVHFGFRPNFCDAPCVIKFTCEPLSHNALILCSIPVGPLMVILAVPRMTFVDPCFAWCSCYSGL